MTRDELDRELGRMVVLKGMPGDSDVYWDALRDIPLDAIRAAVQHAVKTRAWFPTPAEVRHDCDAARPPRAVMVPPTSRLVPRDGTRTEIIRNPFGGAPITVQVTQEYVPHCDRCGDTGMVKFWCGRVVSTRWPWLSVQRCQRRNEHGEHDWAGPCACVDTNPVIVRRKEAQRERYSQDPEKAA